MDINLYKDRMLETENLTDELEDVDANWLLNWGIHLLDQVLWNTIDEETAGENVNALMAVIRRINRICGWRESKSTAELALDLEKLSSLFAVAFKINTLSNPDQCAAAAVHLAGFKTTAQALEFLTSWGRPPVSPLGS
jgi:hypothetical protein